ncbi:hypothetical protein [Spirulina sp. 06S082]|uniref:hypothetical protein n=1 Tax=Spirulina sp. 06S082 TaxID=3110248 RepID=UPI002B21DA05|nr:hypothetical protein [Spirulina sp. 06S082]MEA5472310.1 hypothetical protein [Spirulina sp. 06S082]
MSYSNFQIRDIIKKFAITLNERSNLFADIVDVEYSEHLAFTIQENLTLAVTINTEKSRSEMIITPILLELRRQLNYQISLFSGKDFNVDPEQGLKGICDYLISLSPEQLLICSPVIAVVEAKKEDIISGLGQCIAEMIAAQIFNQREENNIKTIYGVVTSGTNWRFLKIEETTVYIDNVEYYIKDIGKILGILKSCLRNCL